jgi:hypothetical protein
MLVFEVPDVIKVFYEKENDLLVHEWLDYNPEDRGDIIFEILQRLYDIFLAYPTEKVLVRADQTRGAFSPSVQKYIAEVQFPRILADCAVRYVVTIQSQEAMMQISTSLWQEQLEEGAKIILHDVGTEAEAREWLETIDSMRNREA